MRQIFRCLAITFLIMITVVFLLVPIESRATKTKANVVFKGVTRYEGEQTLKYDVVVSDKSAIAGITMEILYNSKQLKLVESKVGEVLKPTINKINSQIEGKVILTAISSDAITDGGVTLHLEFEVNDPSEQYLDITCTVSECINQNCDELPIVIECDKIKNPMYFSKKTDSDISEDSTETKYSTVAKEFTETKEPLGTKDKGSNADKVLQNNIETKDKNSKEDKSLQDKTEIKGERVEASETVAPEKEQDSIPKNNNIIITMGVVIVILLILATWIRRRKK